MSKGSKEILRHLVTLQFTSDMSWGFVGETPREVVAEKFATV